MIVGEHLVPISSSALGLSFAQGSVANQAYFCRGDEAYGSFAPGSVALLFAEENCSGTYVDAVLVSLGALYPSWSSLRLVVLGNLITSEQMEYNCATLQTVLEQLQKRGVFPILISSNKAFAKVFCQVKAAEAGLNLSIITAQANMASAGLASLADRGQDIPLKSLSVLAHQGYLSSTEVEDQHQNIYLQQIRLGMLRDSLRFAEPPLRDANLLLADMSSMRHSDFSSSITPMPNGLYAEEICQLMRYAGYSENLGGLAVGGFDASKLAASSVDAMLVAQSIWHFCEGFSNRRNERPGLTTFPSSEFFVDFGEQEPFTLRFTKSEATGRWWLNVVVADSSRWVACDAEDYEKARHHEIPLRWVLCSQFNG